MKIKVNHIERCERRTGSGTEELWRKVTPLKRGGVTQQKTAHTPMRVDKSLDKFSWELDHRHQKGGL